METNRHLLIITDAQTGSLQDEIDFLKAERGAMTIATAGAQSSGSLLKSMMGSLRRKAEVAGICRAVGNQAGALLAYGGNEIADAVAKTLKIPCIRRCEIAVNPSVAGLRRAKRHEVSQHALTVVTPGADSLTVKRIVALAVARPGSVIVWRPLVKPEESLTFPENMTVSPVCSIEEAVKESEVDWFVALGGDVAEANVLKSLSAAIPVALDDCGLAERLLNDDCAVIFGALPESEEFVRGMLPFIDSDYRSRSMSDNAYKFWNDRYDLKENGLRLVAEIDRLLNVHQ